MKYQVSPRTAIVSLIILSFLMAACQTTGPVQRADQDITLEFNDTALVAPPRSVQDIEGILETIVTRKELSSEKPAYTAADLIDFVEQGRGSAQIKAEALHRFATLDMGVGNYARAITLFGQANARWPHRGDTFRAMISPQTALCYAYAGDLVSAERALKTYPGNRGSGAYKVMGFAFYAHAQGVMELAKGNYAEAERYFIKGIKICRRAEHLQWYGPVAGVRTLINVDLAENYMRQGRLLEAEIIARDQLMVVFTGTIPGWLHSASRARVLRLYSQILFEQGRFTDARIVARAAVLAHRVIRDDATSVSLNECRQILARTHLALGDWEAASQVYTLVQRDTRAATGFVADRFARDPDMALTFLVAGKYQEARDIFEKALEKAVTEKADAYAMGELQALYAAALAATGEKANAEKKFRETLPRLIAAAGARNVQLRNLVTTRKRLAVVLEAYLDLLSEKSTRPEPAALSNAFRLAEMAKSQTVQRSVVLSSVRAAARDPELARMVRKEQDTLKRMETMRGSLINAVSQPVHKQDITVINDLRERLLGIEKSGRDLRDEIERRFPRYGELTTPQPPDIDRVRSVLKPDEAMLVYFIGHSHSWVWAVPAEGEVAFARVKAGHNKVREMVATVRKSLDPQITRLDELPPFDLAAAYTLYQNFLAPVEAAWSQSRHLLVVPHGPLGYLPFAVLPVRPGKPLGDPRDLSSYRDTDWLVRSHRISTLPSVTTGVALRSQPEPPPRSRIMAAFANPVFDAQQTPEPADTSSFSNRDSGSPERVSLRAIVATEKLMSADLAVLPPLPETADEVLSMAQVVGADPQRDVFLGSRATEQRVKTMDLTPYRILVFATHGLKPGDLDGLLQPALALSSPAATHSAGNGFLTMGEILGLRLNADWVILSACNTGAGDGAASEALSGLGQAFFYAGARALLVSNWPVETHSAKRLTTDMLAYQAQKPGISRAEALRQAMLRLLDTGVYKDPDTGEIRYSYGHPIFWAPFSLVGEGG